MNEHPATRRAGNTGSYPAGVSKVTVSLPDDLLARVDEEAKRRGTSRSAFLAVAAWRELDRRHPHAVAEAVARAEQRLARAGRFNAAELVRADREDRR